MKREDRRPEFFPFFPAHWIASHAVQAMTPEERGCFIHLLAQSWLDADCSIPACHARIAAMCGIGRGWKRVSDAILREFPPHPTAADKLANPRLLKERALAEELMQRRSKQRTDAANKRWGNDADAMQPHTDRNASRNALSRGTEQNGTEQNGTESAPRARDATPALSPSVVEVFPPTVLRLADLIEAKMPRGKDGRGSPQRRAGVAKLVEQLGEERVAAALEALPSLADRCAEAGTILRKLAGWPDSLDGSTGIDRIEWIERLLREHPPTESDGDDDEYVLR